MTRVDSKSSFINFVYPFRFDGHTFYRRAQSAKAASWEINQEPTLLWENQQFDLDEVLPYVAEFLNTEREDATAQLWKLRNTPLINRGGGLGADLTRQGKTTWFVLRGKYELRIDILDVQLIMFHSGIGFVTMKVQPWETEELRHWIDLINFLRFGTSRRGVTLQQRMSGPTDTWIPCFPNPAGGMDKHPNGEGTLYDLLCALLNPLTIPGELSDWWKDVFIPGHWLPYTALFLYDTPQVLIPEILVRLRNFFHWEQKLSLSDEDRSLQHPQLLPYAHLQWFFFSLEGGGFAAFDPIDTPFFRSNLPDHLAKSYYLLFLLTLHQRFTLTMLVEEVAKAIPLERDPEGKVNLQALEERRKIFEHLRNDIQCFTARGYFSQVMQRQNHHRCYLKWQEVFQLERLYNEVNQEIRYLFDDLQADYERIRSEKVDRLRSSLESIAWLFGPPALYLAYLDALGNATARQAIIGFFFSLAIGGVVIWLTRRVINKSSRG